MSPFKRGVNHCSFCSSVPYLTKTSILPVSGALQLKTYTIAGIVKFCPKLYQESDLNTFKALTLIQVFTVPKPKNILLA